MGRVNLNLWVCSVICAELSRSIHSYFKCLLRSDVPHWLISRTPLFCLAHAYNFNFLIKDQHLIIQREQQNSQISIFFFFFPKSGRPGSPWPIVPSEASDWPLHRESILFAMFPSVVSPTWRPSSTRHLSLCSHHCVFMNLDSLHYLPGLCRCLNCLSSWRLKDVSIFCPFYLISLVPVSISVAVRVDDRSVETSREIVGVGATQTDIFA